jgi:hypothetical protein
MFTKKKLIGGAKLYRTVIDWDAVRGAIILAVVGLIALGAIF